eukprot:14355461-Alexandrium_andersonii.AAC.1
MSRCSSAALQHSPQLSVDRSPAADQCSLQFLLRLRCCPAALLRRSSCSGGCRVQLLLQRCCCAAALAAAQLRP